MSTLVNATRISKIIYFDSSEEFSRWLKSSPDYISFTLCIVKINDCQSALYYGSRQLKDTIVTDSYPDSPEYPLDKLYLHFISKGFENDSFVDKIYYKFKDSKGNIRISPLEAKYLSNVNSSVLTFSDGTITSLCSLTDRVATQNVVEALKLQAEKSKVDNGDLFWRVWQ